MLRFSLPIRTSLSFSVSLSIPGSVGRRSLAAEAALAGDRVAIDLLPFAGSRSPASFLKEREIRCDCSLGTEGSDACWLTNSLSLSRRLPRCSLLPDDQEKTIIINCTLRSHFSRSLSRMPFHTHTLPAWKCATIPSPSSDRDREEREIENVSLSLSLRSVIASPLVH